MSSRVKKRENIELIKRLLDGNWYDTHYLALTAGKYIPPEIASRKAKSGKVDTGRANLIYNTLEGFVQSGRFEKRHDGRHSEWRLKDFEWAKKMVIWAEKPLSSLPPLPEVKTISLPSAEYNVLSWVKQAYEQAKGEDITWEAFLVQLIGFSLGSLLSPRERRETHWQ